MKFWPTDAFRRGVASAIAVFLVFCGAVGYLLEKADKLKDERIATLDQRAETLDTQLSDLLDQKWREKYEAEHLQVVTLTEEVSLMSKRYKAQIEELNAKLETVQTPDIASLVSSNAQLKYDNEVLEGKLRLANTELSLLREFHIESVPTFSPASGALDTAATQILGQKEIVVKRGHGWSSSDGVATFGVEGINFTRARRGISSTYFANVKVFGERQVAQAGSSYSKEIDGKSHRITVTGISTTDQTVSIVYVGPEPGG